MLLSFFQRLSVLTLFVLILTVSSSVYSQQLTTSVSEGALATSRLRAGFDTILPKLRVCTQTIVDGHEKICNASTLIGIKQSIEEVHAVHIEVLYNPRPIGGILTVTVNLVPAFAGVGTAARPLISKSLAQAVDRMTTDDIEAISNTLIAQLAETYAQGTPINRMKGNAGDGQLMAAADFKMSPHTHVVEPQTEAMPGN